ncbi:hypothetical protein IFM89_038221 [Coptis chinensis]|uniref:Uncharacterized protein n=1 Tax=Coptis chinensis TaxID=261450 RepID=A0A835IH88_9MAGN|nr:hypothetical protein IFM89_038221 [Coptis chinensis]
MALLNLNLSAKFSSFTRSSLSKYARLRKSCNVAFTVSPYMSLATAQNDIARTERRSANYMESIWNHDDLMNTQKNGYTAEVYVMRANILKDKVTQLLDHMHDENGALALLELIDDIERLGLGYVFERNIRNALRFLNEKNLKMEDSLETTALYFRLLRQHGFNISQDVFRVFKDPQGSFKEHLCQDIKSMVRLFEASYLGLEGEDVIDEANTFSRRHLMEVKGNMNPNLAELVTHALDLPLHYRIGRLEARWYIDAYSRRKDANSTLLELAKLDYNKVQATYQKDLMEMSRWWKNLDIIKNMPFSRDRLAESFLWSVGVTDEPQYSYCREVATKIITLITVIDDFYDVYATYDEAKLFTDAVERWDINAVEQLPDYIKLCFFALYNTVNEFAYNALKEHGMNILPYLRKQWVNQCKSYLLESKWFHTGYKATLGEYLENGCVSITAPMLDFHLYISMTPTITKEELEYIQSYPDLIHWGSMALRLIDDLGTSEDELARGDVPKAIQCHMHDTGVTAVVARERIRHLADEAWKKQNREQWAESTLPGAFVNAVTNLTRTSEIFYQYRDGHGIPDRETKNRIQSLLVDPFPM